MQATSEQTAPHQAMIVTTTENIPDPKWCRPSGITVGPGASAATSPLSSRARRWRDQVHVKLNEDSRRRALTAWCRTLPPWGRTR
jgi:hypothetical protein